MNEKFNRLLHEHIRALLAPYPEVREGRMFGYPAFFVGKRMFACLYGEGLGLKLPAGNVALLLGRPGVVPFRPHGKPAMREWIQINHAQPESYQQDMPIILTAIQFVTNEISGRGK